MLLNYIKLSIPPTDKKALLYLHQHLWSKRGFCSFFYYVAHSALSELKSDQFRKDRERIVRLAVNFHWTDVEGDRGGDHRVESCLHL